MSSSFDQKVNELHKSIDIWADEVRREFGFASRPDGAIGISFMPDMQLPRVPDQPVIEAGFYISNDLTLQVEVLAQQCSGDILFVEVDDPLQKTHTMSSVIFHKIFDSLNNRCFP